MLQHFARATFLSRGDGFHFAEEPPARLEQPEALNAPDPWDVLCALLIRLRRGDFSEVDRVVDMLEAYDDADVWTAGGALLSYAAPYRVVRRFAERYQAGAFGRDKALVQLRVCEILSESLGLWTIPVILGIYRTMEDVNTKLAVEVLLSQLLEDERGPIYKGPDETETVDPAAGPFAEPVVVREEEPYLALVQDIARAVASDNNLSEDSPICEGRLFSVVPFTRRLLARIGEGSDTDRIERGRILFEANTGFDCHGYYVEGRLQPLAAAAILEEFLETDELESYRAGVRYFFGHRIPA
jgi:hypothetical protein